MSTKPQRKSTRWSRWRERRREKAYRASDINRRMHDARSAKRAADSRGSGDSGSVSGGAGFGGM
jgi:hypothetical protein